MANALPNTPLSLLSRLRDEKNRPAWDFSWKRFLELYHGPLLAAAAGTYRYHTGNGCPPQQFLEDVVAEVVREFFTKKQFDPTRGRLRTYLRLLVHARVVDALRKEKPFSRVPWEDGQPHLELAVPPETPEEKDGFECSLLNMLLEDLRDQIPLRQFEIFEMVKLKSLSPEWVAGELGIRRNVVDNTVYKVMKKLREISARPEYRDEYYA